MELGKARSTEEIIKDIKATLESKVKDNVATHGGEINFLSIRSRYCKTTNGWSLFRLRHE